MIGRHVFDFVHPDSAHDCKACFSAVMHGEDKKGVETIFRTKDGESVWVVFSASSHLDETGKVQSIRAILHDVTERKLASLALKHREEQLAVLAEAGSSINEGLDEAQILSLLVDFALRLVAADAGAVGLLKDGEIFFSGYTQGGERRVIDLSFPEGYGVPGHVLATGRAYISNDAQHDVHVIPEIRQMLEFNKLIDVPIHDGHGGLLGCFEIHDRLDGEDFDTQDMEMLEGLAGIVSGALLNARLISDLTDLSATLRQSESRYRQLVELMPDGIVLIESGKVVFANPEAVRLYGFDEDAVIGQSVVERIHPDDIALAMGRVQRLLKAGEGFNPMVEERMLRLDGSIFVAETASAYVEYEGRPAVLVVLRDVSERVAAQQEAQRSAETVRSVARNVAGVIFQFGVRADGSYYFPYISESVERLIGVVLEEVMADAAVLFARAHPHDLQGFIAMVETSIARVESFVWQGRFLAPDDSPIWFNVSAEPQGLEDGSVVWNGVALDETTQHQLEEQFQQAQKMESVGTLVGGIAHDFNNMLAGMLGQLYLVRHELQDDPAGCAEAAIERINAVDRQGVRAAGVISQLMTFARKGRVVLQRLDVNQLVTDALRLHRVAIPENINIQARLGQAMEIEGDAGMLQQMLLNLLSNARDALEDKPQAHIRISLKRFDADKAFSAGYAGFAVGAYACLSVADNGCGMSEKQIQRIFDPFFTTKEVGKGTGLGLAMLYGGMQTHHGHVLVDSSPGEGTRFDLYFPLLDGVGELDVAEEQVLVKGASQTILLADDEPSLLEVIQQALEIIGYRVLTAKNGQEALEVFKAHSDVIDLALLDVVMPLMGGVETAEAMRELRPDFPVIFHTGYGEEAKLDAVEAWKACTVVHKPVNIEALSRIIADML